MEFSELLNYILGGGLFAAILGIVTLKATLRKANADAEKAIAEAEKVRIDNAEHATRILIENIVEPLKKELHDTREELRETKKEFGATKREMARLRKAIGDANSCKHSDDCPVLYKLRDLPKGEYPECVEPNPGVHGQPTIRSEEDRTSECPVVSSGNTDTSRQPP